VALAVEAARDALTRRRRLAEGAPLEAALERFLEAQFREQGRLLGLALPGRLEALDALWEDVTIQSTLAFVAGIEAAYLAAWRMGATRAAEDIHRSTRPLAREAAIYKPPPGLAADIPALAGFATVDHKDLRNTPFDVAFPQAKEAARRRAAELVANVDAQTRDRLRTIVTNGRGERLSPTRIASNIKAEFPYMAKGSALRHIQSRAHLIAVTETAYAHERGAAYIASKGTAAGLTMVKSWLTVGDGAVDDVCAFNEVAGEIPAGDSFGSGDTEPPAHPGCRCTAQYRALTSAELGQEDPFAPGGPFAIAPALPTAAAGPTYRPHGESALKFANDERKLQAWADRAMRGDASGYNMPGSVRGAFRDYSGSMYRDLNATLRGKVATNGSLPSRIAETKAGLDKGMVALRGTLAVQMWRGVPDRTATKAFKVSAPEDIKVGMEMRDEAFMSVSGDQRVARNFGDFVMDVRVAPGTRARYMGSTTDGGAVSGLPHEAETLLERGMTLVVREAPVRQGSHWLVRVDAYHPRTK